MAESIINYVKNKTDFLKTLENAELKLNNLQNYIPLYEKFFVLNETNWNNINLQHQNSIIECSERPNFNTLKCKIFNSKTKETTQKEIFVKFSPLLDPIKYIIGKYDHTDETIFNLPKMNTTNAHIKTCSPYNSAYTDSFFSFLTSKLLNEYNFIHGLDFYGSYLANLADYKVNIYDDIEYVSESPFFNKNMNHLFKIDNEYYEFVSDSNSRDRKKRLLFGDKIDNLDIDAVLEEESSSNVIVSLGDINIDLATIDDIVSESNKKTTINRNHTG